LRKSPRGGDAPHAEPASDWLAVSLESFGRHSPAPAVGLLAIGDAASFIDPFTGSGMLMALESGELVAGAIAGHVGMLATDNARQTVSEDYLQTLSHEIQFAFASVFDDPARRIRTRVC
jgi:flavin-dependent dehydrogenase